MPSRYPFQYKRMEDELLTDWEADKRAIAFIAIICTVIIVIGLLL